jgi:hypothetical protein
MIQYGSFESEDRKNKYLSIIIERDNYCVKTGAIIYPYSVHLHDVTTHTFIEDGDKCPFSTTGFCSQYDNVRWASIDTYLSPKIVCEIVIERIEKVIKLKDREIWNIQQSIYNEIILKEEE